MKRTKAIVLQTVDVTGYGRVMAGERELPQDIAALLVERGYAVPAEESDPEDDSGKKRK